MTAETTSAFARTDEQHAACWRAIGDLARMQLAALTSQVTVAPQRIAPSLSPSGEAVLSRAA